MLVEVAACEVELFIAAVPSVSGCDVKIFIEK